MFQQESDSTAEQSPPSLAVRLLRYGAVATMLWIMAAGYVVSDRHAVPSILEYKSVQANFAACGPGAVAEINICMDTAHAGLMKDWRRDIGASVILPPMFAWLAAGLGVLGGLYRRWRTPA